MSANMERILKQANAESAGRSRRILELNTRHPLIRNLTKMVEAGQKDQALPLARMLYDEAMLLEGAVHEPASLGRRLQELLTRASESALR
jgi:molecular chaperone HtpG